MAKYSYEFKKKVVQEYLEGKGGYAYLAKQYNNPNKQQVRIWVNAHNEFGDTDLIRSRKIKITLFNFYFILKQIMQNEFI